MRRWEDKHIDFVKNTADLLSGEAYAKFCEAFPGFIITYNSFSVQKSRLNACKSVSKNLKWTPEMLDFIKSTKGQDRETSYKAFCEKFTGITATAFNNQRSRSGISPKRPHCSNKRAKLYEERVKSGYVVIKVAEPCTWISKARWVYEETNPGEKTEKTDNFIFLNGNNRDFSPANIERIESRYRLLFLKFGGADKNSEITKIRILQAKMRSAQLDLGEKIGKVKIDKNGRHEIKKG